MPTPGTRNLRFTKGDDFAETLTFTDGADNPIDLSGHTVTAQIRRQHTSTTSTDFTVDDTDAATGVIVLTLDEAATGALAEGAHVWDLQWVTPAGDTRTVLAGTVTVDAEVTR